VHLRHRRREATRRARSDLEPPHQRALCRHALFRFRYLDRTEWKLLEPQTAGEQRELRRAGRYIRFLRINCVSTPEMSLEDCRIIDLPRVRDPRGNLTFIESGRHLPFEIKRVYYLYDVPGGSTRAGHGHKTLQQVLIAMSGSFTVVTDDGFNRTKFRLNRSYYGLYIPPLVWREIEDFFSGSVFLAVVSDFYEEADYYRDYEEFLRAVRGTP